MPAHSLYAQHHTLTLGVPTGCAEAFAEGEPEGDGVVGGEGGEPVRGLVGEGLGGEFGVRGGLGWVEAVEHLVRVWVWMGGV